MRLGAKRYIFTKRSDQKKFFCAVFFFVAALFVFGTFCYFLHVIRPTFAALAENRAKEIAIYTINEAISEKFVSQRLQYTDIVELERGSENKVTAVKSDLIGISKLKSELNLEILEKISKLDCDNLHVPLGSLMGNDIFAGLGPNIPFQIKPYGTAITDIKTTFSEAGINQTKLDVTVNVKTDLSILMPTMRKKSTVETSVPIIQTVIVGDIPDSYTHVDRDGLQYEDDVLELVD